MTDPFADFVRDTTPERAGPGRYRIALSHQWSFRHPSGGVLMALGLRAAELELGRPELRVRSATTVFESVVEEGTVEIEVEILRAGNAAAQVRVRLSNEGAKEPGLDVIATFAVDRDFGPRFSDGIAPAVPPPAECAALGAATPVSRYFSPRIFHNIEVRLAAGHPWWEPDWTPGEARLARWMRYGITPRRADGTFDPLALSPLVDTMPPSTTQRLGPGFEPFIAPSLDLTVHFLERTEREWLLIDTHTRWAGTGYGSADVEVWDDEGRLVAFATQMWIFRRVPQFV